jgi:hypothetical protein
MQSDGEQLYFWGTGPGPWPLASLDGKNWKKTTPAVRLPGADPGAVQLDDGTWLALVTSPPRRNVPNAAPPRGAGNFRIPRLQVQKIDSKYKIAAKKDAGFFATGQAADLALGAHGFNQSGGPTLFNHPTGLATDGRMLLMTDRWNNRVLIWKSAPDGNVAPDLVLGQPDFEGNDSGAGLHQLNWPGNVAVSPNGQRIAVTDTNNDRILIWNSLPKSNGQPADVVIDLSEISSTNGNRNSADGQSQRFTRMPFSWPWGVWTDGAKLAVVATHGAAILMWNEFPSRHHQPPDVVLRPQGVGTPRNITSDGKSFFAVSDHNFGPNSRPATLVWDHVPTESEGQPQFTWNEWLKGSMTSDGKLVMAGIQSIFVWDRLPRDINTDATVVLRPASYRNGDGPDAVVVHGRLYVCNYNGNNILGWNSLPTRDHQPPDFSIGSQHPTQDTWSERFFIQNPALATDGTSLFAGSDFDRKLFVWRELPDESNAPPDWVFELPEGPWDIAADRTRLAAVGRQTVYLWDQLPLGGEQPSRILSRRIGSIDLRELTGVAIDSKHLFIADRQANRIYVWNHLPQSDSEPTHILEIQNPGRLSSDGIYLAAAPFEGHDICVWPIDEIGRDNRPYRLRGQGVFNLPGHALSAEGKFFVADRGNHRVHVWHRIEDALDGKPADAFLGAESSTDRRAGHTRYKLNMPGSLAWTGGYLWVGEFKFSTRILRYSPAR